MIQAGQIERVVEAERGERLAIRLLLDDQDDIAQMLRERRGQPRDRVAGDPLDRVGVRRRAKSILPIRFLQRHDIGHTPAPRPPARKTG